MTRLTVRMRKEGDPDKLYQYSAVDASISDTIILALREAKKIGGKMKIVELQSDGHEPEPKVKDQIAEINKWLQARQLRK